MPTIRLPQLPLQKAIFDRLTAQLAPTPVYDDVPEEATFPYVVIGDDQGTAWYTKTFGGREVATTIHVWSQYRGEKEAKEIMDKVVTALTNITLSLTGNFTVVGAISDFDDVIREPDGITRHGAVRIRFIVQDLN